MLNIKNLEIEGILFADFRINERIATEIYGKQHFTGTKRYFCFISYFNKSR